MNFYGQGGKKRCSMSTWGVRGDKEKKAFKKGWQGEND